MRGLQCLLKNGWLREWLLRKCLYQECLGRTHNRLHFQNYPDLALWNLHIVIEVSLAFMIPQLVEIRTRGDPTGHPDHSPAGRELFPAVYSVALGGITFHMIIFFFMLSSTKCFLNWITLYSSNKMHNRQCISGWLSYSSGGIIRHEAKALACLIVIRKWIYG